MCIRRGGETVARIVWGWSGWVIKLAMSEKLGKDMTKREFNLATFNGQSLPPQYMCVIQETSSQYGQTRSVGID